MRKLLLLLLLLSALLCGKAQSHHLKFNHFTVKEGLPATIEVKDNCISIPDAIKDKIMQPFFTTNPTGEGTGLGLSLTYDMVVKVHKGTIDMNSKEGEGSEFIVQLPIT